MLYQLSYSRNFLCLDKYSPDLPYIIRWFLKEEPQAPVSRHRLCPALWVKMDSNHRSRETADLQSAPFGHSGIHPLRRIKRRSEPLVGIEPTTYALQVRCSTIEP